ncbi:radical SAM family heme chaperone HemW [Candidatus Dependentiae bacterium]
MTYRPDAQVSSIYIHWPFCAYKCHFCPFVSFAGHEKFMAQYNNTLNKEIELFSKSSVQKADIETLFIGGGTPSTWPDAQILDTFDKLYNILPLSKSAEVTIEVNPGTVRVEQLEIWRNVGINRLSVGVQSLNDSVLKNLNRHQKAQDVHNLLHSAKDYFDNTSIDLILGLPGVSDCEWKDLLKIVVGWPIHHISIYFLTIYEKTPIYYRIESGEVDMVQDDDLVELYNWSVNFLEEHGFDRYEISNFAKKGYECRHNKVYWNRKPYRGFGLAACSFDGVSRFKNHKDLLRYIECVENCETRSKFFEFCEKLTDDQIRLEKLMLGLRTDQGVTREQMFEGLSKNQKERLESKILYLKSKKFIYERDERFVISPNARTLENEIVLELLVT